MKSSKRVSGGRCVWVHRVCGLICACLLGLAGMWFAAPVGMPQADMLTEGSGNYKMQSYQAGDLKVSVHIGLTDSLTQTGRYAPAVFEIENAGEDFSGSVRLYVRPTGEYTSGEKAVIEKNIQLAAGETKRYTVPVRTLGEAGILTALCDDRERVLGKKYIELSSKYILSPDSPTIGLISEDDAGLSYMATQGKNGDDYGSTIYAVQDWMLTEDWRTLDLFDVLVVNQFDTGQLTDRQIAAINDWVDRGGTLILGTGAQPERTLEAFSGTLLNGTIGDVKEVKTSYGANLQVSELNLQGAEAVLKEQSETLVSRTSYGKGCVLTAGFDLSLTKQDKLQEALQDVFQKEMSADRLEQMSQEQQESENDSTLEYSLQSGLSATEVSGLPNITLYAVLLLIYAVLVGPILYSILRKRGKRELLWKLIPVTAVFFSVLIYLIGTSTRVKQPYMNYLTQIDLTDSDHAELETGFSITSPRNNSYDVEIDGSGAVAPGVISSYMGYDTSDTESTGYGYRIAYTQDGTTVHMDNMSSFDSVFLSEQQTEKMGGRVEFTDLNLEADQLAGIVTNHAGYDLEDCMLIVNGSALFLGDMNQNESIALDSLGTKAWKAYQDDVEQMAVNVLQYDSMDSVSRLGSSSGVQDFRRFVLLSQYLSRDLTTGYYFYGFMASDQEQAFTEQFDMDMYGETAVMQKLTDQDLAGGAQSIVGSLERYMEKVPEEIGTDRLTVLDSSSGKVTVTYDLSGLTHSDHLQLRYSSVSNLEFDLLNQAKSSGEGYVNGEAFLGDVLAVNPKTGKGKTICTCGKETLADITSYIDQKGRLTLTYHFKTPAELSGNGFDYSGLCLPRLILERRNES